MRLSAVIWVPLFAAFVGFGSTPKPPGGDPGRYAFPALGASAERKVNVAWNCVHRWAQGPQANVAAAIGLGEDGSRRSLTFAELSTEVAKLAEALVRLGSAVR